MVRTRLPLLVAVLLVASCHDVAAPLPAAYSLQPAVQASGDGQTDTAGALLAQPLRVRVLRGDVPAAGIAVAWRIGTGAGSLSELSTVTDSAGIAEAFRTLGPTPGEHTTEAALAGAAGSPVVFSSFALDARNRLVVSNARVAGAAGAGPAAGGGVTYAGVARGAFPTGRQATLYVSSGGRVATAVVDGGFDPVPVPAGAGDTIEVEIEQADGSLSLSEIRVPAARRPTIVRTEPQPRRRDVPLNARVMIVFSEPIAAPLAAAAIELLDGSLPVAGSAALLDPLTALFTPDAPLAPLTEYRLVVAGVRDLDGQELAGAPAVSFTTGSTSSGAAATIDVTPDSVYLSFGTFQLRATVRDAAGTELVGEPVAWSSSGAGLTVSATGLITPHSNGSYIVRARAQGLEAMVLVGVSLAGNPATLDLQTWDTVRVGATQPATTSVRDAAGKPILNPSVTWQSSDPAVLAVVQVPDFTWGVWMFGVSPGTAELIARSGPATDRVTVHVAPSTVAAIRAEPATVTLGMEDRAQITVEVTRANGDTTYDAWEIDWSSSNSAVSRVYWSAVGGTCGGGGCLYDYAYPNRVWVTGSGLGSTLLIVSSEGKSDTVSLTVTPRRTPVSVTVEPAALSMLPGTGIRREITAVARDGAGVPVSPRPRTWTTSDTAVAKVATDANGRTTVTAVAPGTATITASTEGVSGTAQVTVPVLAFASVSAACGIAGDGSTYCWNYTVYDWWRDEYQTWAVPVRMGGSVRFTSLSAGGASCGLDQGGLAWCFDALYFEINRYAGMNPDQWGFIPPDSFAAPVAVPGQREFTAVYAGATHACALTAPGAAYCWGWNRAGQLGDGSTTETHVPDPVAVSDGFVFQALAAGGEHTCGLTAAGTAYCWGGNGWGQLGDSTRTNRSTPVLVGGGHSFVALTAGGTHTCGLTSGGAAYCWGGNYAGQLGDQSASDRLLPVPVAGGLSFASLTGGSSHTCGLTSSGTAYCWGANSSGQLGDGSDVHRQAPVAVAGGQAFVQLSAGYDHSCAVTASSVAYCWGIGSGAVPAKVLGQP